MLTADCPRPFVQAALLSSPPIPVSATFTAPSTVRVRFSEPLSPSPPLLAGNWFGRQGDVLWNGSFAFVDGADVVVQVAFGFADVGPDIVSYRATPPDVVSLATLLPAAAFTDFPVA